MDLIKAHWYVVYTKPRKEALAQFHLRQKGLEIFFPQLLLPESNLNFRRVVPLFPSYLFVKIRISTEFQFVTWSPGVKRLVSFDGVPSVIEDSVVAFLMRHAGPNGIIQARSNLRVGQEVRITGGPFEGLVGIIQEPPNSRERVKVLLSLLSRRIKLELPVRLVDTGSVVYKPAFCDAGIASNLRA